MLKKMYSIVLIVILILTVISCQQPADSTVKDGKSNSTAKSRGLTTEKELIKTTGVIQYIDLEGGFYGIYSGSDKYDPVNLPEAFQIDGLQVEFTAELLEDMVSIHMWGKIIRLITMKTLDSENKLVMDQGTITQNNFQGCPWIIKGITGTYKLMNLANEYQIDKLEVKFVGKIRDVIISVPPYYPMLELIEIEKINSTPAIISLNQEFKLPVKYSAIEPEEKILFTFKEVLNDSRCPQGVECVWEGEAIILVNVKIGSTDYGDFKMSTIEKKLIISDYSIEFIDLAPYPVYRQEIDPDSYIGYFLISSRIK